MLKTVARECAGDFPNWEDFDYGLQSLGESRERSNAADASRSESETILCTHSTQQAMRTSVEPLNAASRE